MSLENDPFADIPPSLTIPIEPPIKFENRTYDQLVLREPTGGERRKAEEQMRQWPPLQAPLHAVRNYEHYLISFVSGVPQPIVEKIPASRADHGN
jgi:hypothetical protein